MAKAPKRQPATKAQVYAAQLNNERNLRMQFATRVQELENECAQHIKIIGQVKADLAAMRGEMNRMTQENIDISNASMLADVGLSVGESVIADKDGWQIVSGGTQSEDTCKPSTN